MSFLRRLMVFSALGVPANDRPKVADTANSAARASTVGATPCARRLGRRHGSLRLRQGARRLHVCRHAGEEVEGGLISGLVDQVAEVNQGGVLRIEHRPAGTRAFHEIDERLDGHLTPDEAERGHDLRKELLMLRRVRRPAIPGVALASSSVYCEAAW